MGTISLSILLLTALWGFPETDTSEVRADWVERDLALADEVLGLVRSSALLETGRWPATIHATSSRSEERASGFGGTAHFMTWPGGYGSHTIRALVHRGRIVELSVSYTASRASWPLVQGEVAAAWSALVGVPFALTEQGLELSVKFEETHLRFVREIENGLGLSVEVSVPRRLRRDFERAKWDYWGLVVSAACGDGASSSFERRLIEKLVRKRRADLLSALLLSRSPEARVMAALGFRELIRRGRSLSPEVLAAIAEVAAGTEAVRLCEGCLSGDVMPLQAIERYEAWVEQLD